MTDLAMLAVDVGVNERTLRRAVSQGTLRGTRPTPRTLNLPVRERHYVRRSWPLLAGLRAALRTEHNVRFALLFGSAAAGTDTAESDVDILVDLTDPSLERMVDLSEKLERVLGRRVDLIRLHDAEADPLFLADVVSDGRVVVDRERLWPQLRESEADLRRRGNAQRVSRAHGALAAIDRLMVSNGA